jgi:hypothetical protein
LGLFISRRAADALLGLHHEMVCAVEVDEAVPLAASVDEGDGVSRQ